MNIPQKFRFNPWLRSRTGPTLILFSVVAAFFLTTEHTTHLFGVLPYALLLLSTLLFLFLRQEQDNSRAQDIRPKAKD